MPLPCRIVACCLILSLSLPPMAFANPQGAAVRHGQVSIQGGAGNLQIRQLSNRAVIDWESFSIDRGELTQFIQPGATAAALNRVRGSSASQIEGMLRANGRVYLINPNGILIGPNGSVDVAGFVASTLDPGDRAFLKGGSMRFSGASDAAVINLGSISALDGDVVLMGASVLNAGEIRAPRGTAALAAGNDILLAESGEERVFVKGAGGSKKSEGVTNTGNIEANIAELKAHGGNIYGIAVKNEGRVAATGVTRSGGQIFLSAGGGRVRSTGTLKAKRSDGSGGKVKVDSGATGKTEIGGTVDTSSETGAGGEIAILGREIEVFDGALILNDGETMGGTTRIGGGLRGQDPEFANSENVRIGSGATISANATGAGGGGTAIVFAEGTMHFDGHLSVSGAAGGSGGFAELSGRREVFVRNLGEQIDLGAANGPAGTLLIDPINVAVINGVNNGVFSGTSITDGSIVFFLTNTGHLSINTSGAGGSGDITLANNANITWGGANNLSFVADRDFTMNGGAVVNATGAGGFSATAARSLVVGSLASITTTNGNLSLSANAAGTTTGNFTGVRINGGTVQSLGSGLVSVTGRGGDSGSDNLGVDVIGGGKVAGGTSGTASVTGYGGNSTSSGNIGVQVTGVGSQISSNGAGVSVQGFGGGTGATSGLNSGVFVATSGVLTSGAGGNVVVEGTGGGGAGNNSKGVWVSQSGTAGTITSGGGSVSITGVGGGTGVSSNNQGVHQAGASTVISTGGGALTITGTGGANTATEGIGLGGSVSTTGNQPITFVTDGFNFVAGSSTSGTGTTTIRPLTNGTQINLGAADSAGVLGLTDGELDRITAGTLQIGNNNSGAITVSNAITRAAATNLNLTTGGSINFSGSTALLDANGGNVTLNANNVSGAITSGGGSTDIRANVVTITGGAGGIGSNGNPLITDATSLSATVGGNGSSFLSEIDTVNVGVLLNYLGSVNLISGTFRLTPGGGIDGFSPVFIDSAAVLQLNGTEQFLNSLSGSGSITNASATAGKLNIYNQNSSTFSGVLGGSGTNDNNFSLATEDIGHGPGGTLTLSGANTYTGGTTVNFRTLKLGSASALGSTSSGTIVAVGAVLDLNGQSIGAEAVTLNGTGISSGGALINSSVTAASLSGNITLASASSIGGSGNATFSGTANGGFGLTLVGAGTKTFSGIVGGSTAPTSITQDDATGAVRFNNDVSVGSGGATFNANVTLDGLTFASGGPVSFGNAATDTLTIIGGATTVYTTSGNVTLNSTTTGNEDFSLGTTLNPVAGGITLGSAVTMSADKNFGATANGLIELSHTNADLTTSGTGAISLTTPRNIILSSGSSVTTVNGNLTLSANQQPVATSGNFIGVFVNGGTVQSTGLGQVSVKGRAGDASADLQIGVSVTNGGQILGGTSGTLLVEGTGRTTLSSLSNYNYGVQVTGSGSLISSNGAAVSVTGLGGRGFNDNYGVYVNSNGQITSGGSGDVTVEGTGGNGEAYNDGVSILSGGSITSGGAGNVSVTGTAGTINWNGSYTHGVILSGSNSRITSGGGSVSVTGYSTDGGRVSHGVWLQSGALISSGGGAVSVTGESGDVALSSGFQTGVGVSGTDTSITSGGGNLTINGTGANGGFETYGVLVNSSGLIRAGGSGSVSVTGTAGTASDYSEGVGVYSGADITSNSGAVSVTGFAGTATGSFGYSDGIRVHGSGSTITSGGGNVSVTGSVTAGGANESYGVIVNSSGQIISTGFSHLTVIGNSAAADYLSSGVALWGGGKIFMADGFATVEGTGSTTTNLGSTSSGILLDGLGSQITTTRGNLLVDGTGGTANGPSYGIWVNFSASIAANESSVLTIDGTSGSGSDVSYGVALYNDADILGGDSGVFVTGTSGTVTNSNGIGSGVALHVGNVINSTGGNVSVTGQGGTGGIENRGVSLFNNSIITAGGTGSVSVTGFGGDTAGIIGFNESSAGVGILSNGTITSTNGAVTVTGTGGDANGTQAFSYGVRLADTGATITSGGGNVSVTGTGGAVGLESYGVSLTRGLITSGGIGTVQVEGYGGGGLQYNEGVSLYAGGTITSNGGAVTVIGQGGTGDPINDNYGSAGIGVYNAGSSITSGGGDLLVYGFGGIGPTDNHGIWIWDGGQIVGSTGTLYVSGTGGSDSTPSGLNHGILIEGLGSRISASSGDHRIAGIGGGDGSSNHGIRLQDRGEVVFNGAGLLTLDGTAGVGNSFGISVSNATNGGAAIRSTGGGDIELVADSLEIASSTESIAAGSNLVTFLTKTIGHAIDLGGADSITSLGLSDNELDRVTAGTVRIGNIDTGTITVSDAITHGNHLSIASGGAIDVLEAITMAADKDLSIETLDESDGTISLSRAEADLSVSGTGKITVKTPRNLRLASGSSITSTAGRVSLTANLFGTASGNFSGISLDGASVTTTTGNLFLYGIGGTIGNGRGIDLANDSLIGSSGGIIDLEGSTFLIDHSAITNTGIGTIDLDTVREFNLRNDSLLSVVDGNLKINANAGIPRSGDFTAITIESSELRTTGLGDIRLTGRGGDGFFFEPSGSTGIRLADGAVLTSTGTMSGAGSITLHGTGGEGGSIGYAGISMSGPNATINSVNGDISLTSPRNLLFDSGSSVSAVDGNITLIANQEVSPTPGNFSGIDLDNANLSTTGAGTISLTGRGGDDEDSQHGIYLRGGTTITTENRNLTLSGVSLDPLSSGIRILQAGLGAGGGTLQLVGNGGSRSIYSSDSSATIGEATDTVILRSLSGDVEILGQIQGADLQVQDFSGSESVDFLLTNASNDVDRINAFSNGSNSRVASLDYRDTDGFQVTEFLGAVGISASGNVSLRSNLFGDSSVVVDRPVRSAGGNILIRGLDVVIDATDVTTTGSGTLTLEAGRAILVWNDSLLSVNNGAMRLEANQGEGSLPGSFTGITVLGSRLQSLGTGGIQLSGAGGDGSIGSDFAFPGFTNPSSNGIRLDGGTVISSSDSSTDDFGIELYGGGGRGVSDSVGVSIANVDTIISSAGRSILIEGYGGGAPTGLRNRGVLFTGGLIQAANSGNVTVYGDGGDGVGENDGIQFDNGARIQVNGGDLTLDGYAGETLGIGVMLGNNSGNLLITGTGSATVKGSGNNAPGVVLGNSSAVIGGVSADYVDIFSRQGNLTLQREALAGGNVFINADFGDTFVGGEVTSGTGDVEIEGDNVTIDAPVTATYGDVTVIFGDNFVSTEAEPEEPLEITFTFDGTGTINQLPTAGGQVRYVGGNGTGDLLTFAGYTASEIDLDSADLSLIENVIGTGSSNDRLRGPAAASNYEFTGPNAFNVGGVAYSAFENVLGGGGDDLFAFNGNASIGGVLDAGGGTNRLDYSGYGTGVVVDLPLEVATGIIGGFENISNFTGSGNIDTVTGPGSASTYYFSGTDSMQVGTVSVSGFENLIAGPLEDRFVFQPGSSLRGFLNAGASPTPVNNILDYSAFGGPTSVNLTTSTAGNLPGGFSGINRFLGSASTRDAFVGPNTATNFLFSGLNSFNTPTFQAAGFENLTGGAQSDTFVFAPNTGVSGDLSGGTGPGSDTLTYANFGRPITVNIGPNTTPGVGGNFSEIERIVGSPGNDRFNFLNQTTIDFVDGGPGTDLIEINDSNLGGENTYEITANSVSRNPFYSFNNFEALRLFLGNGNNTVNSGFFPYTQFLHGGNGFNTLNLPGVTSLNGSNPIRNVHHFGFDAPRPGGTDTGGTDTGGLLQLEVDQNTNGPDLNTGQDNLTENRFSVVDPGTLNSQIAALGGAFSASVVAQAVIATVDGNSYLVLRPFSLDGSGLSPSNLGMAALNESLGVDANLELAAAIGFDGPVFLFNPDGPYSIDLSGVPADPAILTLLQESLSIAAAAELAAAIGLSLTVSITGADGITPISLDGSVPGQNVVLIFGDQLGDAAQAELNAAIAGGN